MKDKERCCGTCKYHRRQRGTNDWLCSNEDCEYVWAFTGYADGEQCEEWEARE